MLTVNVTQHFLAFSPAGESCRVRVELLIISVSCETGMREEGGDDHIVTLGDT